MILLIIKLKKKLIKTLKIVILVTSIVFANFNLSAFIFIINQCILKSLLIKQLYYEMLFWIKIISMMIIFGFI